MLLFRAFSFGCLLIDCVCLLSVCFCLFTYVGTPVVGVAYLGLLRYLNLGVFIAGVSSCVILVYELGGLLGCWLL